MIARIADLKVEIPTAGDLVPRCAEYICENETGADIIIRTDSFSDNVLNLDENLRIYLESGTQFYGNLLRFNGMMIHASAVSVEDKAYLFSGDCGAGKSTHTRIWRNTFGDHAKVFNDDKPALRCLDDTWYAYGTPWCGKDGININMKVPLAGICFLKQGTQNSIRRLSDVESVQRILKQTIYRLRARENMDLLLTHVDKLVRMIPVFELENRPESEAAYLSYETMRSAAEELRL